MVKFTGLQIVLLVLVIALIVYLIFTTKKRKDKKQDKIEGKFEKLLRYQKETQYIVPSRYEEGNNEQESIITFGKVESDNIISDWLRNIVLETCNKNVLFQLPHADNDQFKKIVNTGIVFSILNNSNKSVIQKKDDLGMYFILLGLITPNIKYRVLYNDTVQLAEETAAFLDIASNVSFQDFKDAIYNVLVDVYDGSDAAKARYRERRKRFEQNKKSRDPSYELSNDQKIDDMYMREREGNINSAQVYCQNI